MEYTDEEVKVLDYLKFGKDIDAQEVTLSKESVRAILDIICRQNEEIERLTLEYAGFRGAANSFKMHYENAKAEAVKEFAVRVWRFCERYAQVDTEEIYSKGATYVPMIRLKHALETGGADYAEG